MEIMLFLGHTIFLIWHFSINDVKFSRYNLELVLLGALSVVCAAFSWLDFVVLPQNMISRYCENLHIYFIYMIPDENCFFLSKHADHGLLMGTLSIPMLILSKLLTSPELIYVYGSSSISNGLISVHIAAISFF